MNCSDLTSLVYLTVLGIIIGRTTKIQLKRWTAAEYDNFRSSDFILVFELKHINDFSDDKIAKCLNISKKNV